MLKAVYQFSRNPCCAWIFLLGGTFVRQNKVLVMKLSVKAMIFHGGRLLLLQKKDKEGLHPWEFPGGGVQSGEDFEEALIREVGEETGLSIRILSLGSIWTYHRDETQQLDGVIFIAAADSDVVTLSDEHLDYRWVTPEEFPSYHLQESLQESLARMARFDVEQGQAVKEAFFSKISK